MAMILTRIPPQRYVYYAEYQGFVHLMLILRGWKEEHCLVADGVTLIKLVSP